MAATLADGALAPTEALPYIDTELDIVPGMRERVELEIEREKAASGQTADAWRPPAYAFSATHAHLEQELARAERGEKLDVLDTSRYQLSPPADGAAASQEAWDAVLRQADTQLGHMDIRYAGALTPACTTSSCCGDTEVGFTTHPANTWRLHNYEQDAMLARGQAALAALTTATDDMNRERKSAQLRVGEKLEILEKRWRDTVSSNLSLRVAHLTAEAEIAEYEARADALRREIAALDK